MELVSKILITMFGYLFIIECYRWLKVPRIKKNNEEITTRAIAEQEHKPRCREQAPHIEVVRPSKVSGKHKKRTSNRIYKI